jgi:hypothetical protein
VYVKLSEAGIVNTDFRNPYNPQLVVIVARVQVSLHLQETAMEGLSLVTETDGRCLAMAGNENILYSLTWNDRTAQRVDDMVVLVVLHVMQSIPAVTLNTHYYQYQTGTIHSRNNVR